MIRLLSIYFHHPTYSARLDWKIALIESTKNLEGAKFYCNESDLTNEKLTISWASPYETLLLSSIDSPNSSRTVTIINPNILPIEQYKSVEDIVITLFGPIPIAELPEKYFRLPMSRYQLLNQENLPK